MAYHSSVIKGGKIALPASIRRSLAMGDGERIIIDEQDGRVVIRTWAQAVKDVQARFRKYIPEGASVVDELIAERRAEAAREDEDADRWLAERGR